MHFRFIALSALCAALVLSLCAAALAQGSGKPQSDLSAIQRLDIMRSKLESIRRSLNSAISSMEPGGSDKKDKKKANADDPRERLHGLDKEVGSILSEVNDIHGKQERSERYDATVLDRLETSVADIDTRVQAGLQATASARTANVASNAGAAAKKN